MQIVKREIKAVRGLTMTLRKLGPLIQNLKEANKFIMSSPLKSKNWIRATHVFHCNVIRPAYFWPFKGRGNYWVVSACNVRDTNFLEVLFEAKIKLLIRISHFSFKFGLMPTWKFVQKSWNKLGMGLDYSCKNIQRTFRYFTYSCNRIEYAPL